MELTLTTRIESGDPLLDTDLRALSVVAGRWGEMLVTATGSNGGLTGWSLEAGGGGDVITSVYYGVSALTLGAFTVLETADTARLILGGSAGSGVIFHEFDAAGRLGPADMLDLPGRSVEAPDLLMASVLSKGQAALYGIDVGTGALTGWHLDAGGAVTGAVRLKGKAADFRLDQGAALAVAEVNDTTFLLAADAGGVTAYQQLGKKGNLRATDDLGTDQGIGIAAPTALETVQAFGSSWVVLAAAGSQSLTVMELTETGALRPADHVIDTLATRFGGVAAMDVVQVGDHVLVLAGGADDGISLLSLLPGGRLVHLQSLAHETGLGLENVSGIEALVEGESLRIFVTSTATPGVSELSLSLADLGDLIRPGGTEARGTSGSDMMLNPAGRRMLDGAEGDDVLVSGRDGAVLTGEEGRDIFVITPSTQTTVITDFEIGIDQLDLSEISGLRAPSQLKATERGDMVVLDFGGQTLRVEAAGSPISFEALFPGGQFDTPDRLPFPTGPIGRFSDGTKRDDRLKGGEGVDIMTGRGGDDRLIGREGDDHLSGNQGHDRLVGNSGADTLFGHAGRDLLLGGRGIDQLAGGAGQDRLNGQGGDDVMTGGRGADMFRFVKAHGEDRIRDFRPGEDVIELKTRVDEFGELVLKRVGSETWIETGKGMVILEGVVPGQLSEDDFVFL